jgi:FkbM family methyltransferase
MLSRIVNHLKFRAANLQRQLRNYHQNHLTRDRILDFGQFQLVVPNRDLGGIQHETMYWSALSNSLERELIELQQPDLFLDIGANDGFSAALFASIRPDCHITSIEPNPSLITYLRQNLAASGCRSYDVIPAICADKMDRQDFSIHPTYSQDSRVEGLAGWQRVTLPTVTVTNVLRNQPSPVLIKIDTQGFERQVFAGAHEFLQASREWVIKTEFGPSWLRWQGTDPEAFLASLISDFCVYELPERPAFKGQRLADLWMNPLRVEDVPGFTAYIANLAKAERGYCDLLVLPRHSRLLAAGPDQAA